MRRHTRSHTPTHKCMRYYFYFQYVSILGKEALSLVMHPNRDKLLDILPDLHPDAVVSQYVNILTINCIVTPTCIHIAVM